MRKIAPKSLSNPGHLLTFLWPAISSILCLSNTKFFFFWLHKRTSLKSATVCKNISKRGAEHLQLIFKGHFLPWRYVWDFRTQSIIPQASFSNWAFFFNFSHHTECAYDRQLPGTCVWSQPAVQQEGSSKPRSKGKPCMFSGMPLRKRAHM